MKVYKFERTVLSDAPGWECDFYKSNDITGTWMTERGCMVAILEKDFAYCQEILELLDEYALEELLLKEDVYCQFIDE